MDDEYTPSTKSVEIAYSYVEGSGFAEERIEAFHRWLRKVKADTVKEIIQEIKMIPNWGPRDDREGGEFDLDGESHRRVVLRTLREYETGLR